MHEYFGTVYLTALTTLSSSTDTPTPVYLQVWIGMDDDFQLSFPLLSAVGRDLGLVKMSNPDIGVWAGTDKNNIPDSELVAQGDQNILTSGNPLLNYRSMQFPSMSSDGLEKLVYPSIGSKRFKHKNCRATQSYEFASVKELCNMLSPMERTTVSTIVDPVTSASYANAGRTLTPFAWMDRGANDSIWYNYLFQVMTIFRYARGSVRFAGVSDRAIAATANMGDIRSSWDGSVFTTYTQDVFFDSGSITEITSGSHLFSDLKNQPADIVIPYYSNVKAVPQSYNVASGNPAKYPTISYAPVYNDGSLLFRIPVPANTAKGTEIAKIVWLVAGGDDLQLGYQIPVPRCRFSKAPLS